MKSNLFLWVDNVLWDEEHGLVWTKRSKDHKQILHLQVCCRSRQICVVILRTANCKDPFYNFWCCPSTCPSLPKKANIALGRSKEICFFLLQDLILNSRSQTPTSTQNSLKKIFFGRHFIFNTCRYWLLYSKSGLIRK